ncbi:ybaK / prolyl-tRNA synthetases associated domain protein, partial [Chlamydia psittaci C1/97]
KST